MPTPRKSSNFYVGVIDGTGPAELDNTPEAKQPYAQAMAGGFCRQLADQLPKSAFYLRGPSASGAGLQAAVNNLLLVLKQRPDKDVVLVGYSRGALGCARVAEALKQEGRDVHAMLLFDPVDRAFDSSPYKFVPNNVASSYRAYRDLSASFVLKYEASMGTYDASMPPWSKYLLDYLAPSNPIRPSFSRALLGVQRGGRFDSSATDQHVTKTYVGSHGAMGGVGYSWVDEDAACQADLIRDVKAWLEERIDTPIALKPGFDPNLGEPRHGKLMRAILTASLAGKVATGNLAMAKFDGLISKALQFLR